MFDFADLFQWDRFNGPASTEIGREREQAHFVGQVQGRSVGRRRDGGDYV
jgi:hypothetical protein